jgi:hypothetical protein
MAQKYQLTLVFAASLFSGLGIFVHQKFFAIYALTFACFGLWHVITKYTKLVSHKTSIISKIHSLITDKELWLIGLVAAIPFGIFVLLKTWMMYRWFGIASPNATFDLAFEQYEVAYVFNPVVHLFGVLFDTGKGILFSMPVISIVLAGLFLIYRQNKQVFALFTVPALGYILAQTLYPVWFSWGPATRYLIIPLLVLCVGLPYVVVELLKYWHGRLILLFIFLATIALSYSIFPVRRGGYPDYYDTSSIFAWFDHIVPFFPNQRWFYIDFFIAPGVVDFIRSALIIVGLLIFAYYLHWSNKKLIED